MWKINIGKQRKDSINRFGYSDVLTIHHTSKRVSLPVEERGDGEGRGDEEEDELLSFSPDCDRWMNHLCRHLNRCKNITCILMAVAFTTTLP